MSDTLSTVKPWITFAGFVLIIAVLYWAQAVLVPFALAILLTFVLTPPVTWLQRWIGRVPAVAVTVTLVFTALGLAGWGIARQMDNLARDLPGYRTNIREKLADIRGARSGGSVEKLQETFEEIKTELGASAAAKGTVSAPMVVTSQHAEPLSGFAWLGPVFARSGTAGLVVVMVVFMLLERRELRDRVIGVLGQHRLTITTKALDEAGTRVSRQLLMQSLVNVIYGVIAGAGLYVLGVPYPFVWASLGAALRFIPYLGPVLAAGAPVLVSLAALKGWMSPLMLVGLFVVLELFTNLVLETVLYAGAVGVSQVALIVSVAFWSWLWGPLGLLMATPLTVCLVVLGKHVPGMEFLGTLMADRPALSPEYGYYQRLLARDQSEAADLVEAHLKTESPGSVFDALILPALNYAERDRIEGRLSMGEEAAIIDSTRELIADAAQALERLGPRSEAPSDSSTNRPPREPLRVFGYAANEHADELALTMLAHLVGELSIHVEIHKGSLLSSEVVSLVRERAFAIVCIADLPPSAPSKTRYLVRRLRRELPDIRIIVGRWSPATLADENIEELVQAGATCVDSTLLATRDHLESLLELPRTVLADSVDDTPQESPGSRSAVVAAATVNLPTPIKSASGFA